MTELCRMTTLPSDIASVIVSTGTITHICNSCLTYQTSVQINMRLVEILFFFHCLKLHRKKKKKKESNFIWESGDASLHKKIQTLSPDTLAVLWQPYMTIFPFIWQLQRKPPSCPIIRPHGLIKYQTFPESGPDHQCLVHTQQPVGLCFLCGCVGGIALPTRSDIALITQFNSCRPEYAQAEAQLQLGFASPAHSLSVLTFQPAIQKDVQISSCYKPSFVPLIMFSPAYVSICKRSTHCSCILTGLKAHSSHVTS